MSRQRGLGLHLSAWLLSIARACAGDKASVSLVLVALTSHAWGGIFASMLTVWKSSRLPAVSGNPPCSGPSRGWHFRMDGRGPSHRTSCASWVAMCEPGESRSLPSWVCRGPTNWGCVGIYRLAAWQQRRGAVVTHLAAGELTAMLLAEFVEPTSTRACNFRRLTRIAGIGGCTHECAASAVTLPAKS